MSTTKLTRRRLLRTRLVVGFVRLIKLEVALKIRRGLLSCCRQTDCFVDGGNGFVKTPGFRISRGERDKVGWCGGTSTDSLDQFYRFGAVANDRVRVGCQEPSGVIAEVRPRGLSRSASRQGATASRLSFCRT